MKRIMALVAMAALMMMVLAPAAMAVSPSERNCDGEFKRVQGTVTCTTTTTDPGKNPKFEETTTTEDSSKGNLREDHPKFDSRSTTACDRPGNAEKCPPGQFN